MPLLEELTSLLPTKAARLVAVATSVLAPLAFSTPHFLSPLWPKSTQAEIVLAQLLLPTVTTLLGSWAVLWIVVRHSHAVMNAKPGKISLQPPKIPTAIEIEILQFLCRVKFTTTAEMAGRLGKNLQLVEYHLTELEAARFIMGMRGVTGAGTWSIQQPGRAYLVNAGLLT